MKPSAYCGFLAFLAGISAVRAAEAPAQTIAASPAPVTVTLTPSTDTDASPKRTQPFILGADIAWVYNDEHDGAKYYDKGVEKDIFQILKDYKFNYVRLEVLVDTPRRNPAAGLRLDDLKVMAKRAKDAGLGILLDFMYSDNWASPEGQPKPFTWVKLPFPELVRSVHDHTKEVVAALKEQGTPADMVQIGNEITFGFDWPDGRVTSKVSTGNPDTDAKQANVTNAGGWAQLAQLIKAGIAGAKEADPNVKIMLHHSLGRNDLLVREWIYKLLEQGVQWDIIGLSMYAQHSPTDWQTTIDDIATHYPQFSIVAVEYSTDKKLVNDLIFNAPNAKGAGSFIWEPTRHRETLFDRPAGATGNGGRYDTNKFIEMYPEFAKAYGNP